MSESTSSKTAYSRVEPMRKLLVMVTTLALVSACSKPALEPVIDGINFVGVSVSDLDATEKLYSQAAALSSVDRGQIEGFPLTPLTPAARTSLLKSVNAQLLAMQFESISAADPLAVNGPGIAHVCFQVDHKTETYQKFLSGGATAIGDPDMVQLSDRNPVHYAYARDPDGIIFEVEHVEVEKLDLPEPPKHQHRIRHVSLATPDMSRILDFYSQLLSQPEPRHVGKLFGISGEKLDKVSGLPESKIEMAWFQTRNLELEIIQYTSHPTDTEVSPRPINALGYNLIVFDAIDLQKAADRIEQAGGQLIGETVNFMGAPTRFARDPDQNLIAVQATQTSQLISSKNFPNNGT